MEGSGLFVVTTKKQPKPKRNIQNRETEYSRYNDRSIIVIFKRQAVKIGNYSKLGNYKVVMRFIDSSGNKSNYMRMAQFEILSKDRFRHWILLTILGLIATGIAGLILKTCGIGI